MVATLTHESLSEMDRTDLIELVGALQEEREDAKAEAQRVSERNRELFLENRALRQAGNVATKEQFDECLEQAGILLDESDLAKLVADAVKVGARTLHGGGQLYVAIDLPRSIKVPVNRGDIVDVTASRVDSPDRNAVVYEIVPS